MIWNWNENREGIYPEFILKIQDVELGNTKHLIYFGVWISENKFNIGEREHKIDFVEVVLSNTATFNKTKIVT